MGTYAGITLDHDALTRALDAIRAAIGHPVLSLSPVAGLEHDRASVLRALDEVTAAATRADLEPRRAVAEVVHAYQPEANLAAARTVVVELDLALARRVESRLGRDGCARFAALLRHPYPDLLGIFRKQRDENAHSDLIAWLLDPKRAPHVAPAALRALSEHIPSPTLDSAARGRAVEEWRRRIDRAASTDAFSVRREYVYGREWEGSGRLDRVDIVLLGPDFTIAIENKVRAGEHNEQTRAYWSWLEGHRNARHHNESDERPLAATDHLVAGLLLSPNGVAGASQSFRPISALDLVAALLRAPDDRTEQETVVLSAYLKTAAAVMLRAEARAAVRIGETR